MFSSVAAATTDRRVDAELDNFITRLQVIHRESGGPESEDPDRFANKDDFTRIAEDTLKLLIRWQDLIEQREAMGSNRSTAQVALDNDIRRVEADTAQAIQGLEALQRAENAKRRSKYKPEQMEHREGTVRNMRRQEEQLKRRQRAALTGRDVGAREHKTMEESELFKVSGNENAEVLPSGYAKGATRNDNMTETQRQQLAVIKARDKEFDETILKDISAGLDTLQEYAEGFTQRIQEHDKMIDEIQEGVDNAQERLVTINAELKETLAKLRSSDKICLDILCVLIMLGLIGVIFNTFTSNN
mmetsp:Transcript_11711/g.43646  ORF Transcript_11711/g.43646 Transcript_11711/m.43646 type:complete len:302 (-) Transcript_11711:712-1617(-)